MAKSLRSLQAKGVIVFSLRVATAGVMFVLQLMLARTMGLSSFGEYALAFACLQFLTILARLGFDNVTQRFVSQYHADGEMGCLAGFVRRRQQISIAAALLISIAWIVWAWIFRAQLSPSLLVCFILSALILPVSSSTFLLDSTLRALGRAPQALLIHLVRPSVLLLLVVVVSMQLGTGLQSQTVMMLHFISAALALFIALNFNRRALRSSLSGAQMQFETRAWVKAALPLALVTIFSYVQGRSGTMLTGWLVGTADAGLYATIERFAILVMFGLQSINAVAAPRFAVLYRNREREALQLLARKCALSGTAFTLITGMLLAVFGRDILSMLGKDFSAGYGPLLILLLSQLVNAAAGSVMYLLAMSGNERICLRGCTAAMLLNIVLSVILIPRLGILGTALANGIACASMNIWFVYAVRTRLGIWSNVGRPASFSCC